MTLDGTNGGRHPGDLEKLRAEVGVGRFE